MPGVPYDQGVRVGHAARVLDAQQLLLGSVDLAPERRFARSAALAAGEEPVRNPGRGGRETDLPVHGVGGQEDERGTGVPGQFGGTAHGHRPVLVVAREDQAAVPAGVDAAGVQIAGVGVREVVAVPLGPADEVVGVAHVQRQAGTRVGAVEGDRGGGVLLAQQPPLLVPGVVETGAGPAVLRVEVVRLPGDVRQQEQQVRRMVVADGERDVRTVSVDGGEHRDVRPDRPVARDLKPPGEPPVVAGDRPPGGERGRLDDAGQPWARGDLGCAVARVVADAVDVHGELLGRVHRDVEVDGLAGGGRARRGEPLDLLVHVVGGTGAATAPAPAEVGVGVPGDDLAGVVEVVLAAAQPGQRTLPEGIAHGMRQRTRFPPPDVLSPHAAPLPRPPTTLPRRIPAPTPAHHITHALRHRSSRIDACGAHSSEYWGRMYDISWVIRTHARAERTHVHAVTVWWKGGGRAVQSVHDPFGSDRSGPFRADQGSSAH